MPSSHEILSGKLGRLARELAALKLNGRHFVNEGLPEGWLDRLRGAAKKEAAKYAPQGAARTIIIKDRSLEEIERQVEGCKLCGLSTTRANTVFGVGDKSAKILFVGEAPGAEEDKTGEPFVGRAGKLLTDMITAMGFSRGEVYIANIIKCRPPGNRDPLPSEVASCEPYLKRQIAMIEPEVICALGAVAAKTLLRVNTPISKLRGEFHQYENTPLLPTYHPAYLLRNPSAKKDAWEDLQMILKKLGLKAPANKGSD